MSEGGRDGRPLTSGFVRSDFVLTFEIASEAARARLVALCQDEWDGERVSSATWEVTCPLSPDAMELAIAPLLSAGDRVVYYYLSDSKRMFRVAILG